MDPNETKNSNAQQKPVSTKAPSSSMISLVLVLVAVVVVAGLGFYVMGSANLLTPSTPSSPSGANIPATPTLPKEPVLVGFEYTVVRVNDVEIVLNGQEGELILPNDPTIVTVYLGFPSTQSMEISLLKVGDKAKVALIPGKAAEIYVQQ